MFILTDKAFVYETAHITQESRCLQFFIHGDEQIEENKRIVHIDNVVSITDTYPPG